MFEKIKLPTLSFTKKNKELSLSALEDEQDASLSFSKHRKKYCIIEIQGSIMYVWIGKTANIAKAELHSIAYDSDTVEEGYIVDGPFFVEKLKEVVKAFQLQRLDTYTFVFDKTVLYRSIEIPQEITAEEVHDYVGLELNHTIHLPFEDSYFDVQLKYNEEHEAILFATPSDVAMDYVMYMESVKLRPKVLDVRALSVIRALTFLEKINASQVYLIAEWQVDALIITIYSKRGIEFLRYHPLERDKDSTKIEYQENTDSYTLVSGLSEYEQKIVDGFFEIRQILGFYEYSIHKGTARIEQLIIFGSNPLLNWIEQQLRVDIAVPIVRITDEETTAIHPEMRSHLLATLGIYFRGEKE